MQDAEAFRLLGRVKYLILPTAPWKKIPSYLNGFKTTTGTFLVFKYTMIELFVSDLLQQNRWKKWRIDRVYYNFHVSRSSSLRTPHAHVQTSIQKLVVLSWGSDHSPHPPCLVRSEIVMFEGIVHFCFEYAVPQNQQQSTFSGPGRHHPCPNNHGDINMSVAPTSRSFSW